MKIKHLIIGYDLCDDYSTISCYNEKKKEPESICMAGNKISHQIPSALFKDRMTGEWSFGEAALQNTNEKEGWLFENFVSEYEVTPFLCVYGEQYEKRELIEKFVALSLTSLNNYYPVNKVDVITFTIPELGQTLVTDLKALNKLPCFEESQISVQSHIASYEYYALSQNKDLWRHDVGLFEYDSKGLIYYHLTISRRHLPIIVEASSFPLSAYLNYEDYKYCSGPELDRRFLEVVKEVMNQKIVSTVYLCGEGFEEDWMNLSLKTLCTNRRVFKGQNLYAKGACYSSLLEKQEKKQNGFMILNDDIVSKWVYLCGSRGREKVTYELVKAGDYWYNINQGLDFILDQADTVNLYIRDVKTGNEIGIPLKLESLPVREPKTTRIQFSLSFESSKVLNIVMKDAGFGSLFRATDKVWKIRLNIDEYEGQKTEEEIGRLLIGKSLPEKVPYYFAISGVKVYTIEELCYYIYNNIYAITEDVFDEELFYWLEKCVLEEKLSKSLRNMKKTEPSLKELVRYLLTYVEYYSEEECYQLMLIIDEIQLQDPIESRKVEADNYIKYARYPEAINVYTSIIYQMEHHEDINITRIFKGNVYHNLGVAYIQMMNYEAAKEAFKKAYLMNQNKESLKSHLWALKLLNDETGFFDITTEYHLSENFIKTALDEYTRMIEASKPDSQWHDHAMKRFSGVYGDAYLQEARAYIDELKLWYKGDER